MPARRGPVLADLIATGSLPVGTKVHHQARRRRHKAVEATVVREGLRLGSHIFSSPSAAAREVTGAPVDGWFWWKLPDGNPLDTLRSPAAGKASG